MDQYELIEIEKQKFLKEFPEGYSSPKFKKIIKEIEEEVKKERIKKNKWMKINKDRYDKTKRKFHLKNTYGITLDQYNQMFFDQNGKCAICGNGQEVMKKRLYVDHDHSSNKLRGLICGNCNSALGFMKDNPEICEKAAIYLRKNQIPEIPTV